MSTIKVLHVIARMNVGGTARYVGELVKNIPESALVTGHVQGGEIEDPVVTGLTTYRIKHLGRRISPYKDVKAYFELRRIIHELNPEIIHTHTFKAGLLGRLVPGSYRRIHTFHGHLFDDQSFSRSQKILITLAERFLARRTDILISVGQKVGAELRKSGIGKNKKWASIPPGVKLLPKIEKGKARELLNLNPDDLLVGWMARVTSVKNPKLLVEVAEQLPDILFVMAGGGDLFEEISSLAPPNLHMLGWTEASLFWSAVDIALSTSDNEGMPIALIEAQLAGVPVIATDVGSVSEVITDSITGLICQKRAEYLVSACQKLASDFNLRVSMAEAAPQQALRRFGLEEMLHHQQELYKRS